MNKKNIKKDVYIVYTSDIKEALSAINAIHTYTCNNKLVIIYLYS